MSDEKHEQAERHLRDRLNEKYPDALAAVRADQIEKDAALVNSVVSALGDEYFDSDGEAESWTMHKRKTWADGAQTLATRTLAAIRAQLTEGHER